MRIQDKIHTLNAAAGMDVDVNDIYFNRVIINQFQKRKVLPVPKWIQVDLLRVSM